MECVSDESLWQMWKNKKAFALRIVQVLQCSPKSRTLRSMPKKQMDSRAWLVHNVL
jgi:hypothetical protein